MATNTIPGLSNRVEHLSAHNHANVQIGNNDFSRTFHGGFHHHDAPDGQQITRDKVLHSLASHSYRERKDLNPERVPKTCEWFLSHTRFKEWRQCPLSSMLRVSADPGCGKSVLAKYLADHELRTTERTTTCYFFFKDGLGDQSSATMALRCIIHQLLLQRPTLFSDAILRVFRQTSYVLSSTIELWNIITKIARSSEAGEIILIIDAFDECAHEGRIELEKIICQFYGKGKENAKINIKLLLTSRPYDAITRGFRGMEMSDLPVLHLAGEDEEEISTIAKEIDLVIVARVQELAMRLVLTRDEAEGLKNRLIASDNRTYLWVYLTLDAIEHAERTSHDGISNMIKNPPKTVYDAYEKILGRSIDRMKTLRLLEVMLGANRPLKLMEIAEALEIREHHFLHSDIPVVMRDRLQQYIRGLCGLFVIIINGEVFFLHHTAREFLLAEETNAFSDHKGRRPDLSFRTKSSIGSSPWAHTIGLRQAHRTLGQVCIMYLLLQDLPQNMFPAQYASGSEHETGSESELGPESEANSESRSDFGSSQAGLAFALLDYASENWHVHCCQAGFDDIPTQALLRLCGSPDSGSLSHSWMSKRIRRGRKLDRFSPLMLASILGLTPAVQALLKANPESAKDIHLATGRSALSFAAEEGFYAIVELLLGCLESRVRRTLGRTNKHVDNCDENEQTPLSFAALNNRTAVARRLLKAGARPGIEDVFYGTPTLYGLCSEDGEMMDLMLDHASETDRSKLDENLAEILSFALVKTAVTNQSSVITRIISTKRVKSTSKCLDLSPWNLMPEFISLTDRKKVFPPYEQNATVIKPNTVDQLGVAAAHMSFIQEYERIGDPVDVLRRDDENGSTLLHWAAAARTDLGWNIDYLLDKGAVLDQPDQISGYTPFHWTLWSGNNFNAMVLLWRGADVHRQADNGRSAFEMVHWPSTADLLTKMDKNFLRLEGLLQPDERLLEEFIDECSAPFTVSVKASRGYVKSVAIAERFRSNAREVSQIVSYQETFAQTLFHWEEGFYHLTGFELRHLVAAEAVLRQRYDVLNCMLRSGLDGGFKDTTGRTLLHLLPPAAEASLLIDAGADPNAQDTQGSTALHEAVWSGRTEMIRLLLQRGADPSLHDKDGTTPLQDAVNLLTAETDFKRFMGVRREAEIEHHTLEQADMETAFSLLVDTGVGIDAQDKRGQTALHIAATRGFSWIVRALLRAGADSRLVDEDGSTPLQLIRKMRDGRSIIKEFVDTKRSL